MDGLTKREHFERRKSALVNERASFITHYRELSDWISPRRGRFFVQDRNKGDKRNAKIINSAATMALRTLASGMMAGITSPARPWFRLATPDKDMMEFGPVKLWLAAVEQRMREVFAGSNLYNQLSVLYRELGLFGTGCMTVLEDFDDVIRVYNHTSGGYMIGQSHRLEVDTLYREFDMTVGQLVAQFVYGGNRAAKPNWSVVSPTVKNLWDRGTTDAWVTTVHAIEPNDGRDLRMRDARNKPFRSVYYEVGATGDTMLRESGFDEFPAMAPRWDVTGEDIYGTDCPGMTALGDVKALQIEERRKAQAIDKMSNPPLSGPASLRNVPVSSLPGGLTIYDQGEKQALSPVYQVDPRINELMLDIQRTEQRIERAFYADLFLMLSMSDRRQITAREVEERHEEKLLMLGPVLERLHNELLDPLIDRVFAIMLRASTDGNGRWLDRAVIPEPPQELRGMDLKVEYISILAQAQKAVGTVGIERIAGFVGGLAAINPEVVDKLDLDQMVDDYGELTGVSPKLVRPDDDVAQRRAQRAKQVAAQQAIAQAQPMAETAKTLTDAKLDQNGQDMLSKLTGL